MTLTFYLFMINIKMKKVKAFFYIFFKSLIPNDSYYTKILRIRFIFSFKYFISLIVFLSLLLGFSLLLRYSPKKINLWLKSINSALTNFPSDLNIFIDKGYLISSYNRPYFFWLNDDKGRLKLIFVIDENASVEKIDQYQTKALLTKTDLFIKKAGEIEKIPLSSFSQIVINKETLKTIHDRLSWIEKYSYILYFFIFIFILVLIFSLSFLINFFYLFLASLLVFVLLKLKPKRKYHFKKIIQIGFHAATLPFFLNYLGFSFAYFLPLGVRLPIKLPSFPLLFLFVLIIFVIVGVYKAYHDDKNSNQP